MAGIDWTTAYRTRLSRRMFLATATNVAGIPTLLAACGGEDDEPDATATTSTSGAAGVTPPASASATAPAVETPASDDGEAKQGGTLRMGFYRGEIITLDPALVNIGQYTEITGNIFNGLVTLAPDLSILPDLAEEWEVSDDGLVYTFSLRQGVTVHNGDPFTSADVVYTYERTANPDLASPHANKFAPLDSVEAPDDSTVVFTFSTAYAPFLANTLSRGPGRAVTIVNKRAVEELGDEQYGILPNGTGPFRITRHDVNARIDLEAFEDHWGGRPFLDKVEITLIPEPASAISALEAGDIDFLDIVPNQGVAQLEGNDEIVLDQTPSTSWTGLNLNQTRTPWENIDARMAVAKAIDREDFIERGQFGLALLSHGPLTPGVGWAYRESDPDNPQAFDLDAAKELAASSGVEGLTVEILATAAGERNAEIVRLQLAEIGLTVNIDIVQGNVWNERWLAGDYDMMVNGSVTDPDPDDSVWNFFYSEGPWNTYGYISEQADALLVQQREILDRDERRTVLHELEDVFQAEVPFVFMSHNPDIAGYYTYVKGFVHVPEARALETVWLDQ